jgi:hypothetical protein
MAIKDMPRRVERSPVIKALWLGDYSGGSKQHYPGYFAFVLTYEEGPMGTGGQLKAHLMYASGLDTAWRPSLTWSDLTQGEADKLFADHEKLAVWPEGMKA